MADTDLVQVLPDRGNAVDGTVEELFIEHYDLVYRIAYRVTGNATDAEDVLQTLFMRMVKKRTGKDRERVACLSSARRG